MVGLLPLDKAGEPDLDRRLRVEAEIAARGRDVGKALRHVAGLQRQQLLWRVPAGRPLEYGDEDAQLLGPMITEIVEAMAGPVCRWAVVRRDRAGDDVVDIGEV